MGNCKHMCHSREVVLTHTSNNVVMEAWNGCWTSGASSQKSNGDVFSCCVWEASGHSENTTKTVWSNASQTHPGSGLIDQTMLNLHVVIPSAKTHLKTKQGLRASPELRWTDGGLFQLCCFADACSSSETLTGLSIPGLKTGCTGATLNLNLREACKKL